MTSTTRGFREETSGPRGYQVRRMSRPNPGDKRVPVEAAKLTAHPIEKPGSGTVSRGILAARDLKVSRDTLDDMTADPFLTHRSLLFTIAYEMLGSSADAEDVVQETWLRWDAIGSVARDEVRDSRAYLVRMVTRQALNRLRTLARQREDYVGEWLPEPLQTSPDVAEDIELAESVSIALLVVLETLGPVERAVFVLREVFDVPHDEIAEAVDKSPAAVRQIAHRARQHVAARRPRMDVSRPEQEQVVDRFLTAVNTGDMQALMEVLAPDVVMVADGGGLVPSARRPVEGMERVAALLSAFPRVAPGAEISTLLLNGAVAARIDLDGKLATAVAFVVEDGRIANIYAISNPQKLARFDRVVAIARS